MSDIPESVVNDILVKCGRHCCIYRRFKPLRFQVHHVIERSEGGSNDPDNLIPTCLTCHQDVHTKQPFTRRFNVDELKGHREQVFKMVAEGKLRAEDDERPLIYQTTVPIIEEGVTDLRPEAINMLIELATTDGIMLEPSATDCLSTVFDRAYVTTKAAFKQLIENELIEFHGGQAYIITVPGYEVADALITMMNSKRTP